MATSQCSSKYRDSIHIVNYLNFEAEMYDEFDLYHVGVSGGKDSAATLLWTVNESGWPREKIRATFCDTGNEHEFTYAYIRMLSERVFPIETIKPPLGFYELAKKKGRFPGPKSRFCTQQLKIFPSQRYLKELQQAGKNVLLLTGVRKAESPKRAELPAYGWDEYYAAHVYRPLLEWSLDEVWAMLAKYKIPRNPLYDLGCRRVGCLPCIMSNKHEIRMIAQRFPERIDRIRRLEHEVGEGSTFFRIGTTPDDFASIPFVAKDGRHLNVPSIDDVVAWSKTGYRHPHQYEMDFDNLSIEDGTLCPSNLGTCE